MRENPYITYEGNATFERTCPECGRFVKADETVRFGYEFEQPEGNNATCRQHGRIEMPFVGYL